MKSAHDIVYVKLTDAQAKEFVSNYTGSEGLEVRATSLDETDPQTSNLLTLNTEVNDTSTQDNKYIKRFVGTLTVADKDGNPVDGFATQKFEKYYGEEFNFSVDAITDKVSGVQQTSQVPRLITMLIITNLPLMQLPHKRILHIREMLTELQILMYCSL